MPASLHKIYYVICKDGIFFVALHWIASIMLCPLQIKVQWGGGAVAPCSCGRSSPVTSDFELVVEINPLSRDTGPLWHPSFHSLPSLGCLRYPFINQFIWEDEQLGELCADCHRLGSNSGQRVRSQTCWPLHYWSALQGEAAKIALHTNTCLTKLRETDTWLLYLCNFLVSYLRV